MAFVLKSTRPTRQIEVFAFDDDMVTITIRSSSEAMSSAFTIDLGREQAKTIALGILECLDNAI